MSLAIEAAPDADNNPLPDVEAQMRRALGLYGGMRQRADNERTEQPVRMMDRFGPQGGNQGLHRRRFVQDGEIPVTVVRRDPAADATATPQSSRLQRTEATLAAETAARDRAERALHDAQAQVAALQTKIGHAELARGEAVDLARGEREAAAQLRANADGFEDQLQAMQEQVEAAENAKRYAQSALAEERAAKRTTERALRDATDRAERAAAALSLMEQNAAGHDDHSVTLRKLPTPSAHYPDAKMPARRGRPPGSKSAMKPVVEAEPVKWWLVPSGKAKTR